MKIKVNNPIIFTTTEPRILSHPHIPKPLHGLNPRSINGKQWWDQQRRRAYLSTNEHCLACGVERSRARYKPYLDAHEYFNVDYVRGMVTIEKIVPLCHYCHNFIHSGKLEMDLIYGRIDESLLCDILRHGFNVLKPSLIPCFPGTFDLALEHGITPTVPYYTIPETTVKWSDWKLVFEGREYHSKFKDEAEWAKAYW